MDTDFGSAHCDVVTVTLNPAIDQTLSIPNFTKGAVNRVSEVQSHAGGKGVNVAAVLADYGLRVAATGFLGKENSGSFESLFAEKKITDRFIRVAGVTRTGFKIVDPVRQQTTDINTPGIVPDSAGIAALQEMLGVLDARWFVLAGSVPPRVDPAIYRKLITALKANGAKVAVDTSGDALAAAIDAGPNMIKPNIYELENWAGRTLGRDEAVGVAREIIARGIELVVISMGDEGACFVTGTETLVARPPKVTVKSTVGAGDAMVAGVVAGRLAGMPLANCARLATAFAVDALGRVGAGLSNPEQIDQLMAAVEVTSIH